MATSTDPIDIIIDVETGNYSIVEYATLAPKNNPIFTGILDASSTTSTRLPSNTNIGSVNSYEIATLVGVTGNIQAQLNTMNLSSPAGDILLPSKSGNIPASLIFEGGTPDNYETFITPQDPKQDFTFYLPAPASGTFSITGSTGQDHTVLVGDNLIQSLTNKTLVDPTISGTLNSLGLPTSTQAGSKINSTYFFRVTNSSGNSSTTNYLVPTGFPSATGLAVKAGKTYHFRIVGLYNVGASSAMTHRLNFTGGSVGMVNSVNGVTQTQYSSQGSQQWQANSTVITVSPNTATAASTTLTMNLEGTFVATADGYFYYDFVPATASQTVTVLYGTSMFVSEV